MSRDRSPWSSAQESRHGSKDRWPRRYRIVVDGDLEATWSSRLAGLQITHPDAHQTVLEGPLRDPAELSGVLNALSDLRLAPLRVELVIENT